MMSWSFTGRSLPPRPRYRYGDGWEGGLEVKGGRFMERGRYCGDDYPIEPVGKTLIYRDRQSALVDQVTGRASRLAFDQGGGELQRVGQKALDLGGDLLDDVAGLVDGGADHRDHELERAGAPRDHGREREEEHLGDLDDALGGLAQGQHLEDGGPLAHL